MPRELYELIIVGGGPSGLTAGIYAARARLKTLLIEKLPLPGGLAATTHRIENYPGYDEGISGGELTQRMAEQAKRFGLEIINDEVVSANLKNDPKEITTTSSQYFTKTLLIASGTEPKRLNIPGELKLRGKGVSYCATCDGPIFKDRDVVVVGTGNSGLQEGLFLTRYVRNIYFIEILPEPTGEKILQERLKTKPNVEFYLNHKITEIRGEENVESVKLTDLTSGRNFSLKVQGVFIYAGLDPSTKWVEGEVELDESGWIITDGELRTSVDGVFAAGDVRKKVLRQVATAVGDGALAAFMAEQYLSSH